MAQDKKAGWCTLPFSKAASQPGSRQFKHKKHDSQGRENNTQSTRVHTSRAHTIKQDSRGLAFPPSPSPAKNTNVGPPTVLSSPPAPNRPMQYLIQVPRRRGQCANPPFPCVGMHQVH